MGISTVSESVFTDFFLSNTDLRLNIYPTLSPASNQNWGCLSSQSQHIKKFDWDHYKLNRNLKRIISLLRKTYTNFAILKTHSRAWCIIYVWEPKPNVPAVVGVEGIYRMSTRQVRLNRRPGLAQLMNHDWWWDGVNISSVSDSTNLLSCAWP